jgi:hypothetical protein
MDFRRSASATTVYQYAAKRQKFKPSSFISPYELVSQKSPKKRTANAVLFWPTLQEQSMAGIVAP